MVALAILHRSSASVTSSCCVFALVEPFDLAQYLPDYMWLLGCFDLLLLIFLSKSSQIVYGSDSECYHLGDLHRSWDAPNSEDVFEMPKVNRHLGIANRSNLLTHRGLF